MPAEHVVGDQECGTARIVPRQRIAVVLEVDLGQVAHLDVGCPGAGALGGQGKKVRRDPVRDNGIRGREQPLGRALGFLQRQVPRKPDDAPRQSNHEVSGRDQLGDVGLHGLGFFERDPARISGGEEQTGGGLVRAEAHVGRFAAPADLPLPLRALQLVLVVTRVGEHVPREHEGRVQIGFQAADRNRGRPAPHAEVDRRREGVRPLAERPLGVVVLKGERVGGVMGSRPGRPRPDGKLDGHRDEGRAVVLDESPLGPRIDGPREDLGG